MTYTCACGDTYTEEIAAKGHALVAVEAKAPTCTEAGYEAYDYCTACDYTTYAEVAATGHSYEATVTAPTCTEAGYTTYTCACGDTYVADEVAATGHVDTTEERVEATYTSTGYVKVTCACGEVVSYEVLPIKTLAISAYKNQVRFQKNADGSYAGKFDIRTIAVIKGEDFLGTFGSEAEALNMIKSIGFVYAKVSKVAPADFSMTNVKDIVEKGAAYAGYTMKPVSTISTGVSAGDYAITCLVTNIRDEYKTDGLIVVGYVAWDSDNDGDADSYAYYDAEKVVSFEEAFATAFDKNFPNG
jgi:hypothetical protein